MRKILMLMLGLFAIGIQLRAQNRSITGRVTDAQGSGVPNASVTIKGTAMGTTTATDGAFTLNVPATARTLIVSSVGFQNFEVSILSQSNVTVTLNLL